MIPLLQDQRFQDLAADGFKFACHSGVACFNQCCRKLELWLTPYDVLRLRRCLNLTSEEFIERHSDVQAGQNGWPMPRLLMRTGDHERTCPFLSQAGCTVYEDRPGACRIYPLGRATKGGRDGGSSEEGFFLVREEHCQGFNEGQLWQSLEWIKDQGLETYNAVNDQFLPIITRQAPDTNSQVIAQKMRMFFMACYDLDNFRKFVATTRFKEFFVVPPFRLELAETNDLELLRLGFDWLRFAIFGDATIVLREGLGRRQGQ